MHDSELTKWLHPHSLKGRKMSADIVAYWQTYSQGPHLVSQTRARISSPDHFHLCKVYHSSSHWDHVRWDLALVSTNLRLQSSSNRLFCYDERRLSYMAELSKHLTRLLKSQRACTDPQTIQRFDMSAGAPPRQSSAVVYDIIMTQHVMHSMNKTERCLDKRLNEHQQTPNQIFHSTHWEEVKGHWSGVNEIT